jgi:hypothetical protein
MEVRLLLRLVPDEVYEKRIREKEKDNKKKRKGALSDETRRRYRFNLFITNAGEDILPVENVFPLYQLRWQIELMFKVWKSVFGIDRQHRMKEERYIALLYTRLLLIVINLQMTYRVQAALPVGRQGKRPVLSLNKALKTMSSLFDRLMEILRTNCKRAMTIARNIEKRLSKNHELESKKKKRCLPKIIELFICVSEK